MKVPLSWLKDYVDITVSVKELAQRFGEAGCRRVLTEHTWDKKYVVPVGR